MECLAIVITGAKCWRSCWDGSDCRHR